MNDKHNTAKLESIISQISSGLYEKDNSIRLVLLSFLSGESAFMLGEPGTAKSLIARRVSDAFVEPTEEEKSHGVIKFFDYLMSRFSQPDEVFGPISINKLKSDQYERKTDYYLPKAKFAFLDEIWKANPSIQNTLLTILNEHLFRNGKELAKVPLIGFVSASNELPEPGQGLEAIFDRFLIRILERPIKDEDNFFNMISGQSDMTISVKDRFTMQELEEIRIQSKDVQLSKECLSVISTIRKLLTIKNQEPNRAEIDKYIISDRRWKKIANLMKVSAYCNGRTETDLLDSMLIANCIWSTETQEKEALDIVSDAIVKNDAIDSISKKTQSFEDEVNDLFYEEVPVKDDNGHYECKTINGDSIESFRSLPQEDISIDNPVFSYRGKSYRLLYKSQERQFSEEEFDFCVKTQNSKYTTLHRDITEHTAAINKQLEYWCDAENLFVGNHLRQLVINKLTHQAVVLKDCSSRMFDSSGKYHIIMHARKIISLKGKTEQIPLKLIDILSAGITNMKNQFRLVSEVYRDTKCYTFKNKNNVTIYVPTHEIKQEESSYLSLAYKDGCSYNIAGYSECFYNADILSCTYYGTIYKARRVIISKKMINGIISDTRNAIGDELHGFEPQLKVIQSSIDGDSFVNKEQKEELITQLHSVFNACESNTQDEFVSKLEIIGASIESKETPSQKHLSLHEVLEELEKKKESILKNKKNE